jgi:endonuclease/exonuclease/phosphatase family metal-dependent hydrolase
VLLAGCLPFGRGPDEADTGTPAALAPETGGSTGLLPAAATTPATASTPIAVAPLSTDIGFLERPARVDLRVMTYNVNWDSIFPTDDPQNHDLRAFDRQAAFERILRAVRPDVLCLQEINDRRSAGAVGQFLTRAAGSGGGAEWQVVKARDTVIATPFRLVEAGYGLVTHSALPTLAQAAALVDLPEPEFGEVDLYLICAHFKSGGNQEDILLRSRQADVIMAHVGDFTTAGGELDLKPGTPFVILGDFNAYDTDPARHVRTLLQGDIYDEDRYGADVDPDWDGTALADARPSHNGLGTEFYTWRSDFEPFLPGALDRVIYSDSALAVADAFVLNTALLADAALRPYGLRPQDVLLGPGQYDHLPVVVDFQVQGAP